MYFDYLEEHEMLRNMARGQLARRDPVQCYRKAGNRLDVGIRRQNRKADAAQGWIGMLVPEELGGIGGSAVEALVVAEELGRACDSGAFATINAVALCLANVGTDAQRTAYLDKVNQGELGIAWATASTPEVRAEPLDGGWRLSGKAKFVQDADIAGALLVDAKTANGISQFLVPHPTIGLTVRASTTADVARQFCDVTFEGAQVASEALVGAEGVAGEAIAEQGRLVATLIAADSVGAAAKLLEMTVAYTKERIAFGKPIAAFQAIKHRCADMLINIEAARVATWYAAIAMRDNLPDAVEAAAIAKFYATEAASFVAIQSLQLHGAIGMTWEHDLHIYLKRVKANEILWGSNSTHRELVAAALGI